MWCWRCKMEVPMLNDEEEKIAGTLFSKCFADTSVSGGFEVRFKPLLDYYNNLSGWKETHPNAVMHHMIGLYGPPCEKCGKPYRTNKASFCAACGNKRHNIV